MQRTSRILPFIYSARCRVFEKNFSATNLLNRNLAKSNSRFDDPFFGMATNLMRGLEQEFDFIREQMNKRFNMLDKNWSNNFFLNSTTTPLLLEPLSEANLVVQDKEGIYDLIIIYYY
jgi:hypothetical protein